VEDVPDKVFVVLIELLVMVYIGLGNVGQDL
jgi:hypothetical protein